MPARLFGPKQLMRVLTPVPCQLRWKRFDFGRMLPTCFSRVGLQQLFPSSGHIYLFLEMPRVFWGIYSDRQSMLLHSLLSPELWVLLQIKCLPCLQRRICSWNWWKLQRGFCFFLLSSSLLDLQFLIIRMHPMPGKLWTCCRCMLMFYKKLCLLSWKYMREVHSSAHSFAFW